MVPFARPSRVCMRAHCNKNSRQRASGRASERAKGHRREGYTEKKRGTTARPRQRKVGVSGAIDVARHPRRPLNFRSLVTLSSLAQKSLSSSCPSPPRVSLATAAHPLSFSRADESLNVTASAIFLSEHRRARRDATRRDKATRRCSDRLVPINKCIQPAR